MIRNILTNFSARLSMTILNFVVLLITTHELGKDIRGEISFIQFGVAIIHLISDITGGPALVYLVPRSRIRTLLLTGGAWATFSAFGIGWLLIHFNLLLEKTATDARQVEVLAISLLLSLHSVNQNILLGQERIRAFNILLFMQGVVQVSMIVIFVYVVKLHSAQPYINACFASYGLCFLAGLFFVLRHRHAPSLRETRPILFVLFSNGFYTQMASIAFQLSIRGNYERLTSAYHSDGPVGLFSTALALGEALLLFSGSVASIMMARIANRDDPAAARAAALRMSKFSVAITIPAILIFIALPNGFYSALLGKDFGPVKEVFLSLAPGIALLSFTTVYSFYFAGIGKNFANFLSGSFGYVITLFVSAPLINSLGASGAGWTATLAYSGLGIFIFTTFMIAGGNKMADWKLLMPSRDDLRWIKNAVGSFVSK